MPIFALERRREAAVKLRGRQALEAEALIERCVPGDVCERGQRHRTKASSPGGRDDGRDQSLADAPALVLMAHRQFIEVRHVVDRAGGGEPDKRLTSLGDEAQAIAKSASMEPRRRDVSLGDAVMDGGAERFPC